MISSSTKEWLGIFRLQRSGTFWKLLPLIAVLGLETAAVTYLELTHMGMFIFVYVITRPVGFERWCGVRAAVVGGRWKLGRTRSKAAWGGEPGPLGRSSHRSCVLY